jgi:hypothetical protein
MKAEHRARFDSPLGRDFSDSLDVDEALREKHPQDSRWDYLLGHEPTQHLVGVEPHSAKEDQIGKVIRKREAAVEQLREHLADGVTVHSWLWLSSGDVQFADTERARRRLDQAGIQFVGRRILAKHLPKTSAAPPAVRGTRGSKRG